MENGAQAEEVKEKIRQTNLDRYGVPVPIQNEEVKAKWRSTNLERYGHEYAIASEQGKAAIRKTNLDRYGVEYGLSNPEVRAKIAATNLERYGHANPFANEEVKKKLRDTSWDRYGVEHPMQNENVSSRAQETLSIRLNAGETFHHRVSKINLAFKELVESKFDTELKLEVRFGKYYADLGNEKVLIEINPTITHNSALSFKCVTSKCSLPCAKHEALEKTYHHNRALAAMAEDRRLIQVYDWNSSEKILGLLSASLEKGWTHHSARKLELRSLKQKDANVFLRENHIQGGLRKQTYCYGLYDSNGALLAVSTFGKSRFGAKEEWEWLRYAVARGNIVHGGPNRLFKEFVKDAVKSGESVISYVDFDHTTKQNLFLSSCGFEEVRLTGPKLMWSKTKTSLVVPETSLLRLGADRLLGTSYGSREKSGLNNHDIMALEGYLPVYTAGNRVFRWEARA